MNKRGIIIENDVWIGANSIILDGTVIQKSAVVGAGFVVQGKLEEYVVYTGNPPKSIGKRR